MSILLTKQHFAESGVTLLRASPPDLLLRCFGVEIYS